MDMETSTKQTSLFTEGNATSSQEGSHASHTQTQESDLERRMIDISGRRCLEQYERFNHVGSWGKTFAALLIGMEGWYSMRCRLTWRLKGTKSSRFYFQLVPSTHHTDEIESGLWLTPSTIDIGERSEESWRKRMEYRKNIGRNGAGPGCLSEQVALTKDYSNPVGYITNTMLPTPRARAAGGNCSNNRGKGNLEDKIAEIMLPTPTTRDYKGARSKEALAKAGRNETNSLPDAFSQTGKSSQLNPLFVEEMMGFPPNWTLSPFQNGETNPSKRTETP